MHGFDTDKHQPTEDGGEYKPRESQFETREGMMPVDQCVSLSEEKGKGPEGAVRCDQSGQPGPQPAAEANPDFRPDMDKNPRKQESVEQFEAPDNSV